MWPYEHRAGGKGDEFIFLPPKACEDLFTAVMRAHPYRYEKEYDHR